MSKSKKRSKKRTRVRSLFPIIYPARIGTPFSFAPGSGNDSGGGTAAAPPAVEAIAPSRARVLHEMRRALGIIDSGDRPNPGGFPRGTNWGGDAFPSGADHPRLRRALAEYFNDAPNVAMAGFSVPAFSSTMVRSDGPSITGPGFQQDGQGVGGKYDFKKSPGLGFKTELAWRVWEMAMKIASQDKSLPKHAILLRAMAKSGVYQGQIDASEYRLLEMGVEWYLSDQGSLGAKRDMR